MKLFVYDHCPYCVKARMIFGLKRIIFELVYLDNADEETPTKMIGKKMVPILQKEDGSFMPESLDIVSYVDHNYGNWPILTKVVAPGGFAEAYEELRPLVSPLAMPRWVKAPLEEFKTEAAKEYFTKKKEAMIGSFAEHMNNSKALISEVESKLEKIDKYVQSDRSLHGRLTIDDFHFFASLRSLSIVSGIKYPDKISSYRESMSKACKIPLHDVIAL